MQSYEHVNSFRGDTHYDIDFEGGRRIKVKMRRYWT